ncbi:MAG TPA: sulfate adenylyltransferase subunit CysN [Thiotrichaceae bacterium]|jgi:sulfate adenylyltransferase large subunit|nr:sulfate adenylyltransferase subunit CysN [Thiotrichaceae bacterium]HIM08901.1 sulfate adenylyltransferase subunit CysN [Gammaproteobacteria bacterium]
MSHQSDLISTDIDAYLEMHEKKQLLRLLTCGSVDDGKSTLIGRLLYDSKMIYEDQLAMITEDSVKSGTTGDTVDLALLVDGLQAEREQGITIDVAYRYFSTAKRKFIIADTPGHEQYTRNMATGASNCDLAIILIDARYGVQVQTRRHSIIASLLGIKHLVVAVNKMDLVGHDEAIYNKIKEDYLEFTAKLAKNDIRFIPLSALNGDNVVNLSENMPWYDGQTLMEILESVEINSDQNFDNFRFPVQYVNRPNLDFRGYCGTIASGVVKKGDKITVLPSGKTSTIASIVTYEGEIEEAFPPMAITLTLQDEIDVSRGDMITHNNDLPLVSNKFNAKIVWMTEHAMTIGKQYYIKLGTKSVNGSISKINHLIDVNTLEESDAEELNLNEIGHCDVTLTASVPFDSYNLCKGSGSFIIIDRLSNVTVAAGMIIGEVGSDELQEVSQDERVARYGQQPFTAWLTGKNNLQTAHELERLLFDMGHACTILDQKEITGNIREISTILNNAGFICLCSVDKVEHDYIENSAAFNCDEDSTHDILNTISSTAQLR